MSFKVAATYSFPGPLDREGLAALGVELGEKPCYSEDEVIAFAKDADALAVMVEPFTRRVIEALPKCRWIITPKVGFENIDIAAATEHGICVTNFPGLSAEEVSDHVMALILACDRRIFPLDNIVRNGKWKVFHGLEMQAVWGGMKVLREQTLGLVGLGKISRAIVPKAAAFGLNIMAYDPYCPREAMESIGVKPATLRDLLNEADYVSLHTPLTPETRHMIGLAQLKLMKPTAYLINAARGSLVDESALVSALRHGYLRGAALDVLEQEPIQTDNPLLKLDNVVFTGHSAHYSDRSWAAMGRYPAEEVESLLVGKRPRFWINPEVEERYAERWGKALE